LSAAELNSSGKAETANDRFRCLNFFCALGDDGTFRVRLRKITFFATVY
jgi:hypothetical protein